MPRAQVFEVCPSALQTRWSPSGLVAHLGPHHVGTVFGSYEDNRSSWRIDLVTVEGPLRGLGIELLLLLRLREFLSGVRLRAEVAPHRLPELQGALFWGDHGAYPVAVLHELLARSKRHNPSDEQEMFLLLCGIASEQLVRRTTSGGISGWAPLALNLKQAGFTLRRVYLKRVANEPSGGVRLEYVLSGPGHAPSVLSASTAGGWFLLPDSQALPNLHSAAAG